ncbi:MAG: 4Fe-4S dicluster domain-containing protein [Candidatus Syntrophonatronum acetioxidans]|uniref:4Fe-4S dicluster domain-containing protein n=1 Tax=Candidatus Syntrophonatronum acetioxidans TaxID=1795816 RepID=A0A424YF95_9FIRM|nr:MAG: 4Fe-4S dicluster domain-containing protein [Candidatus Syntrophonatronum acetioxidans]
MDEKLCKKCGICVSLCPTRVFTAGPGNEPRVTNPRKCTRCNLCFFRCPDFAIQLEVNP